MDSVLAEINERLARIEIALAIKDDAEDSALVSEVKALSINAESKELAIEDYAKDEAKNTPSKKKTGPTCWNTFYKRVCHHGVLFSNWGSIPSGGFKIAAQMWADFKEHSGLTVKEMNNFSKVELIKMFDAYIKPELEECALLVDSA